MPELTKSQKVIFAILAVVALYAVYDLILAPSKPKDVKARVEADNRQAMKELVSSTTARIPLTVLPAKYDHLIKRAETGWAKNPFIERTKYNELVLNRAGEGTAAKKVQFVYSGYVDLGSQKIAIINQVDYSIDEHLETDGYILRKVLPNKVVIEDKKTRHRFDVHLQE